MENTIRRNNRYEILTPNGWSDFDGIQKSFRHDLYCVITDNYKIKCTSNHRFKTKDGFVSLDRLSVGDEIVSKTGLETIINISEYNSNFVYDPINVVLNNEYFSNDIISHNCNEYLGSSGTLISGWKLKELSVINQEPILRKNGIYQYERPERGKQYYLIADTSRGKGLDYSAFSIIDVNQLPYRQVCIFRDNLVTPIDYAEIIHRMARIYNDAYCLIENNDIGQQVADLIYHDYEYENILSTESAGRQGKRISSGFGASKAERGIRTTKTVKSVGCSMLKLLVEQNQLEIVDKNTIQELQTFSKKHDSYQAEDGATDDLVMTLVLFGWLTNQDFFKSSTDINTMNALRERSDEEIMADVMPFGIVDNHQFPDVIEHTDHYMPYQPYDQSYHVYDMSDENEGF